MNYPIKPRWRLSRLAPFFFFLALLLFTALTASARTIQTSGVIITFSDKQTRGEPVHVTVTDPKTKKMLFEIDLKDVEVLHSRPFDYRAGYLYALHRTGGAFGYDNNPQWTDTLVRYDAKGREQKLFSGQGLAFLVSPNNKTIALSYGTHVALVDLTLPVPTSRVVPYEAEETVGDMVVGNERIFITDYEPGGGQCNLFTEVDLKTALSQRVIVKNQFGSICTIDPDQRRMITTDWQFVYETAEGSENIPHKIFLYDFNDQTTTLIDQGLDVEKCEWRWMDKDTIAYKLNGVDKTYKIPRVTKK